MFSLEQLYITFLDSSNFLIVLVFHRDDLWVCLACIRLHSGCWVLHNQKAVVQTQLGLFCVEIASSLQFPPKNTHHRLISVSKLRPTGRSGPPYTFFENKNVEDAIETNIV